MFSLGGLRVKLHQRRREEKPWRAWAGETSNASIPLLCHFISWSPFFEKLNSRFMQNFTLLTSHFDHPKMYTLTSHFSYHISHFKSLIYIHILHFTLYNLLCEVWSVKWEMWNENHKSQFPDGKCDLWNKHETWIQFLEKCAPVNSSEPQNVLSWQRTALFTPSCKRHLLKLSFPARRCWTLRRSLLPRNAVFAAASRSISRTKGTSRTAAASCNFCRNSNSPPEF